MPKRTTPFQAIVHLVRQHYAQTGVTVTESKLLLDPVLGEREVDIVIEGKFDGEPVVISLEVNERSRRASIEWAEQQIEKHRRLPTNRLVLVSKEGFSRRASTRIGAEGGWVEAVQPEVVEVDGVPVVKRLYADFIEYKPKRCKVLVRDEGGRLITVVSTPDIDVYDAEGTLLGAVGHLVSETFNLEKLLRYLMFEAHHHAERNDLKAFELKIPVGGLGYRLRQIETGTLHLIVGLHVVGDLRYTQNEIRLTLAKLGDRTYGSGHGSLHGQSVVWVGTTDTEAQQTKLSWRATDKPWMPPQPQPLAKLRFPGLLSLDLPRHPADESDHSLDTPGNPAR